MPHPPKLDEIFEKTLQDRRLSRGEKSALRQVIEDRSPSARELDLFRHRAFDAAREAITDPRSEEVLGWLEEVLKILRPQAPRGGRSETAEALFSPGSQCVERITQLVSSAREQIDVCVFTLTDNRIARALMQSFSRGVAIRIITDDDKSLDRGSDIEQLREHGIPVCFDNTIYHMHHKFALFDQRLLLTGSYNWTRSAAEHNEENIVITDDRRLLASFQAQFEELWNRLA